MFAKYRLILVTLAGAQLLLVPAAPLIAQDSPAAETAPDEELLGPPQIRNFQLPSQSAAPVPAETPAAEVPPTEIAAPPVKAEEAPNGPESTSASPATATAPAGPSSTQPSAPAPTAGQQASTTNDETPRREEAPPSQRAAGTSAPSAVSQGTAAAPSVTVAPESTATGLPWPLLVAVLLIGGIGGALAYRVFALRSASASAVASAYAPMDMEPAPEPAPAPAPARPIPTRAEAESKTPARPAASPSVSGGPSDNVVAIQIRPWLELEFTPERATSTPTEATVHYELALKNNGNAVARNVLVHARMLNAGSDQNREITAFFGEPAVGQGNMRILAIPARGAVRHRATVSMPSEDVREITIEGRRLFIPIVAFNVLYEWGDGKTGQTSKSYLVGRQAEGETAKMGAFRLDLGPRIYRSLGQRASELAVVV